MFTEAQLDAVRDSLENMEYVYFAMLNIVTDEFFKLNKDAIIDYATIGVIFEYILEPALTDKLDASTVPQIIRELLDYAGD